MNGSCAPSSPELTNPVAKQVALAGTILYPIGIFAFAFLFWLKKNTSILLRKRSFTTVLLVAFGTMITWSYTVLYDYLGSSYYPCWLFNLLAYTSIPVIFSPGIVALYSYIGKISTIRLEKAMRKKAERERKNREASVNTDSHQSHIDELTPEFSCSTLRAHFRVVYCGSRDEQERIGNAKLQRTRLSMLFYLNICTFPYLFTYLVRLAMNPQWAHCSGCELATVDGILICAYILLALSLGLASFTFKVKNIDQLRVVREWMYSWTFSSILTICIYVLYLTDPGNVYAAGIYNYRELLSFSSLSAFYFNSVHQVLMSRWLVQKLVLLRTLDTADRFEELMRDKKMYHKLSNFLDTELSSEILLFLRAVDSFKTFNSGRDTVQRKAREIASLYIENRSVNEINISHSMRLSLLDSISNGNITISMFDAAYDVVKSSLLVDGFARFLHKLEQEEKARQMTSKQQTVSPAGIVSEDTLT